MKLTDPAAGETDPAKKKEKQIKAWAAPKEGAPDPSDKTGKKKLTKEAAKALRTALREQRKADWEAWK